ncbi:MAG: hypothetical protein HUU25_10980 [Candidatus Sumerlaeia bacterium]|nr:hypothetical protein [Candidatus Sumerlaeia bacterium]
MSILESIQSKSFLGQEFLTWLLWRSEERSGVIGPGETEVHFGGVVELAAPFGEAEEVTLRGENPAASRELVTALGEGKLVAKAQMRWIVDGVEWTLSVRGETLDFGGLKPPMKTGVPDPEWLERRLELLEGFARVFDAVHAEFLTLRLSESAWKSETRQMRDWVAARAQTADAPPPEIVEIGGEDEA